jgi:catechol 2,3-dioxygenase-like lactoylglutathione lyase family enzyme
MPSSPQAVLETSLYVQDLKRAMAFYERVLGRTTIDEFPAGRGAALQVGSGPSVLLLFSAEITRTGGTLAPHGSTGEGHVAFRVDPAEMPAWRERPKQHVAIEKDFNGNSPSIYFRDPDGNSLELAVSSIWCFRSLSQSA